MEPCSSNHQEIMAELAAIKQKMKEDYVLIEESHKDLVGRMYLYAIVKFVGFTGVVYLISHYT